MARQEASRSPAETPTVNLIAFGTGAFVISHGTYRGAPALFIERAPVPGPVGGDASDCGLSKETVIDGATIITFADALAAEVLTDELKLALACTPTKET